MRKIVAGLLTVVMFFNTTAYAGDITLTVDGVVKEFATAPIIVNDYTMVGMREAFNLLGALVWWDNETRTAHARGDGLELAITLGSAEALINGKVKPMTVSAQIVNDMTMVPLGFLGEVFGYSVSWDAENRVVILVTPEKSVTETLPSDAVLLNLEEINKADIVLEYADAVTKVVERNSTIKKLIDSVEQIKEARKTVWDYQIITASTTTSTLVDGMRTLSQLDYKEANIPLSKEILAAGSEFMLLNSQATIAQEQMDSMQLDENILLGEFNLVNNLELRLGLGLVSENDVRDAKRELEKSQSDLAMLRQSLAAEKENLALMLGYAAGTDVAVAYHPEFVEGGIDIDTKVKGIPNDPSIIIKDRVLKQAEYEYDTSGLFMDTINTGRPPESKLDKSQAVVDARRALEDAKSEMEKNMRSAYSQIKTLEDKQKTLELALDKARDAYATALVSLEAGRITEYEVKLARMGILKAEIDLQKNIYTLDLMRFRLDRPYLLSAQIQ